MSADWAELCASSISQPLADRLVMIRSSFGTLAGLLLVVAVFSVRLCVNFHRIPPSKRVDDGGRAVVWPLYVMRIPTSL
jgi:hypothetical protein